MNPSNQENATYLVSYSLSNPSAYPIHIITILLKAELNVLPYQPNSLYNNIIKIDMLL